MKWMSDGFPVLIYIICKESGPVDKSFTDKANPIPTEQVSLFVQACISRYQPCLDMVCYGLSMNTVWMRNFY